MTMPFTERFKLFKTVADLHAKGTINLSASDQERIESETMDLVRKSVLNRTAMSAPPGFEKVLMELEKAPDADAAYNVIVDFLKTEGIIKEEIERAEEAEILEDELADVKEKATDGPSSPITEKVKEMGGGDPIEVKLDDKPVPSMGGKPDEEKPPKKDESDEEKPPKKDESGEEKPPKKDDKPEEKKDDKPDLSKEREATLRRAQEQEHGDIQELQERAEEAGTSPSAEEMGISDAGEGSMAHEDTTMPARAKKIKIAITRSRTLVAHHEDHGAIFHAVPADKYRNDPEALRRLANRVYGLAVYQGFSKAAEFCNAKMLRAAGVDDDIELNSAEEVEPKNQGILADAEDVNRQEYDDSDPDSALPGGEVDTREKPDKVTPRTLSGERRAVLRRARLTFEARKKAEGETKDILDEAENVIEEKKPSKPSMDSTSDADTNAQEQHNGSEGDVLSGGDDVIRSAHANFKKLYDERTKKAVAEAKEDFVRKFARAVRVASSRMRLNHEEHPIKVAAVDVLSAESGDIEFANGDVYSGMDVSAAVDLTELITAEGHDRFVEALLEKAADLMAKDASYLKDAEEDLRNLAPVAVRGSAEATDMRRTSRRASLVRREAAEGNFEVDGAPASSPPQSSGVADLRSAIGGSTLLGRRLGRLGGVQGQ